MQTISLSRTLRLGVSVLATAGLPGLAWAQAVDYGSLEQLYGEPVTMSATGTPLRVSEAPANMTIITADEIRQSGSRLLPEILSRVPGLDIMQNGINSYEVGVRGYQQPFQSRLLVLIDGRQVFIDDYSRTLWDNLPVNIDDIRQIEIVEGAASALFGSNAAGGVINIVTYSPLYDNNNVASLTGGTQNTLTGDVTGTYRGSWGGTKLSAGGFTAREFDTTQRYNGNQPGHPYGDEPAGAPSHSYFVSSSVFPITSSLQANTEFTFSKSAANTSDAANFYILGYQKAETLSARAGLNWDLANGAAISLNTYYNRSDVSLYETTDGGPPYRLMTDLVVSQLQSLFKLGSDHTFRVGLEGRHKWFSTITQELQPQTPAVAENEYAVSGMWMWQITPELSWTNAARVDWQTMSQTGTLAQPSYYPLSNYSNTINVWSGNSDLVYKPTELDSFRIGVGRGVQLPSFLENAWSVIQHFGYLTCDCQANPRLRPTTVEDFSFDYTRRIPSIMSELRVTPYYEINQDIKTAINTYVGQIVVNGTSYDNVVTENAGTSTGWGVELQMKGHSPSGFRWDGSYSFSGVADKRDVMPQLNYQGSAPNHHLRLLLGYTYGPWEFDAKAQYMSSFSPLRSQNGGDIFVPQSVHGYFTQSARIAYQFNDHFTLSLSGVNVNSGSIAASAYPKLERQVLLTLTARL